MGGGCAAPVPAPVPPIFPPPQCPCGGTTVCPPAPAPAPSGKMYGGKMGGGCGGKMNSGPCPAPAPAPCQTICYPCPPPPPPPPPPPVPCGKMYGGKMYVHELRLIFCCWFSMPFLTILFSVFLSGTALASVVDQLAKNLEILESKLSEGIESMTRKV